MHGLFSQLGKWVIAMVLIASAGASAAADEAQRVGYRTRTIDGTNIFYREAGPPDAPVILMLHGFPTSSHMYRDVIPQLSQRYHVIAPDYPGFGFSDVPSPQQFEYTFDHLATVIERLTEDLSLTRYAIFMQDFGGPVGLRLAEQHPDRVSALIVQNAVAHEEGLSAALDPARAYWASRNAETEQPMRGLLTLDTTKFQYLQGAQDASRVSPDSWSHAQWLLDRPGNVEIQLELLYDYRTNLKRYPSWQAYFRKHQPPTLIVWGKNDPFFTLEGAQAYQRDLPKAELHLLDAGHFAIEEHASEIARLTIDFLDRQAGPR